MDQQQLIQASQRMAERLMRATPMRFVNAVAVAELAHHATKAGGQIPIQATTEGTAAKLRNQCFAARGVTMGQLRANGDLYIARKYQRIIEDDSIARLIEEWAFPTWTGDVYNGKEFDLPRYVRLEATATEIIREIAEYNDGYIYYLANTYIPLALTRTDPHFGGQLPQLATALLTRAEDTQDATARTCLANLAKQLKN